MTGARASCLAHRTADHWHRVAEALRCGVMAQPVRNRDLTQPDRFFVPGAVTSPVEACERALAALTRWQAEHPGSGVPVAVFATRQAAHENAWMVRASDACRVATFRTRASVRPASAPVLLFFPSQAVLDDYDTDPGTTALFVVESPEWPLTAWRIARHPRAL